MAGKGGGAWKVAYADFVTAMMAFFMVMWLTSQKPEVKESIASYFQDPWARSRLNSAQVRNPSLKEHRAGATDPKKKYLGSNPVSIPHDDPESPEAKKPRVVTVRAGERTTTGVVVKFAPGSETLSEEAQERLATLVPHMQGLPNKIEIRGHVAEKAAILAESSESMWQICYARSLVVLRHLESLGISAERMRLSQAGPYEPLTLEVEPAFSNENVRVEVFLLAETVDKYKGTPEQRAKTLWSPDDAGDSGKPAAAHDAGHKTSH